MTTATENNALQAMGGLGSGGALGSQKTVRLVDLIEMLIQKSYHDLLVLAEVELLNPRKSDLDRKIAIMQYLSKTRNYFVRFLALLKWSSSMPKVEKCFSIISYLEEQSGFFVETADVLARMARETLANSKLPCYQVSFAVDVLNSRTCPRVPSCIKEKIVLPDPLTEVEVEETLRELEYALLYRLVTTDRPPVEMRHFVIRRGRVVFTVEKEFSVVLTVMGDDKSMPFRVLDINILVKHRRIGEGRALVHPQQISYLKQVVQSRIMDVENPLEEVYEILHNFCQGLQLEVLYSQLTKYMINSGLDYYRFEGYKPGRELKLAYWEELTKKDQSKAHSMTISVSSTKNFDISHQPILGKEIALVDLDVGSLMMSVIHCRIKMRMEKLEAELCRYYYCSTGGLPLVLTVSLYSGSPRLQTVQISIDYYTGLFDVQLKQFNSTKLSAVSDYLNSNNFKVERLAELLKQVHLELVINLVKSAAVNMLLQEHGGIAVYGGDPYDRYNQLGPYKVLFRFQRKMDITALLAISVHADSSQEDGISVAYHIVMVEPTGSGLKVVALINHDSLVEENIAREMQLSLNQSPPQTPLELLKARLQTMKEYRFGAPKKHIQQRICPVALDKFEETVTNVTTHMMFSDLRSALKEHGFQAENLNISFSDGMATLPVRISHPLVRSCIFRRTGKLYVTATAAYHVDVVFAGVPFQKTGDLATCTLTYDSAISSDQVADFFAQDWKAIVGLLEIMRKFNRLLAKKLTLTGLNFSVEYDVKCAKIFYGPDLDLVLYLSWERNGQQLVLDFYSRTGNVWNPHRVLRNKLLEVLNAKNLHELQIVEFTTIFDVMTNTTPLILGVRDAMRPAGVVKLARSANPQTNFQFISVSLSNFVISWKGTYYVFVRVLPGPKFILTDLGGTEIVRKSEEGRFAQIPGFRSIVESATGQSVGKMGNGQDSGEGKLGTNSCDPDLHYALTKFFHRLRGYPVQIAAPSSLV